MATLSLEQDLAKRIADVNAKAEKALEEQVAIINKQSEISLAKALADAQTKFQEQMSGVSEKAVTTQMRLESRIAELEAELAGARSRRSSRPGSTPGPRLT